MSEDTERDKAERAARGEALRQEFQREEQRLIQQQEQRLQKGEARRAAERRWRTAKNRELADRAVTKVWGTSGWKLFEELRQETERKKGRHASPSRAKSDRDTEEAVVAAVNLARARYPKLSMNKVIGFAFEYYYEEARPLGLPALAAGSFRTKYFRAIKKDNPED